MNHVQLLRCAVQFIAGCSGVLLAILIWGRATPAEITARQQLAEFVELSPAVQERVQLAWRAFREQDLDGQTRVLELHQAVTREPQLANTLERYTTWWTSLKDLERDELRALGEPELLKEITSRYAADQSQQQASEITVVFNPWLFFGRFGGRGGDRSRPPEGEPGSDRTLSPLTLTTSQYADLMQQVVDAPGLDIEVPEMATKLTAPGKPVTAELPAAAECKLWRSNRRNSELRSSELSTTCCWRKCLTRNGARNTVVESNGLRASVAGTAC
jgi:hypothetical protein